MQLHDHGAQKYGAVDLRRSSVTCDWAGIAAELRFHPAGELPPFDLAQTEIGVATACDPRSIVRRRGNGLRQETKVAPGTIWTCPAGVREEEIVLTEWHECLHIYLPSTRFLELSDIRGGSVVGPQQIRYLSGLHDSLIRQIAWTLLAELSAPTSGGRLLAETLALALTARLVQAYAADTPNVPNPPTSRHTIDERRLNRVLEYMAQHIEEDIGIDDLAKVACLSPFHFIRMFGRRMGEPPHRHLSRMRLERAKTMLALSHLTLYEIALACRYSSQANFTRAFHRMVGMTPGAYRRSCR